MAATRACATHTARCAGPASVAAAAVASSLGPSREPLPLAGPVTTSSSGVPRNALSTGLRDRSGGGGLSRPRRRAARKGGSRNDTSRPDNASDARQSL
eukprot:5583226-Alexandrium_andersonii.AAC.1